MEPYTQSRPNAAPRVVTPNTAGTWRYERYDPRDLGYIAVVMKVVERCNINCSYCHVFNGYDDAWRHHPKAVSMETIKALGEFLEQGISDLGLHSVRIIFQGGEPLMMSKRNFAVTCETLRHHLRAARSTEFVMQTNGMLVDREWTSLLRKHEVIAGVSLDGPAEMHDKYRVDHRGRGTYDRVVRGLKLLQESAAQTGDPTAVPCTLTVIDPSTDPRVLYRHLVDDLGLKCVNFLLPKNCHDNKHRVEVEKFGPWLAALFDEWTKDDDLSIDVRLFRDVLDMFFQRRAGLWWGNPSQREWEFAICMASNGDLGPDDEYRAAGFWHDGQQPNVRSISLADFMDSKPFHLLNRAKRTPPTACGSCVWLNVCGGGALLNRYSEARGFDNPSILCEGLKEFYGAIFSYLIRSGVSFERLASVMSTGPQSAAICANTR